MKENKVGKEIEIHAARESILFKAHGGSVNESTMVLASNDRAHHLNIIIYKDGKDIFICADPEDAKKLRDALNEIYPIHEPVTSVTYTAEYETHPTMPYIIKERRRRLVQSYKHESKVIAKAFTEEEAKNIVEALNQGVKNNSLTYFKDLVKIT